MIHNYVFWNKAFNYISLYFPKIFRIIPLSWYSLRGIKMPKDKKDFKLSLSRLIGNYSLESLSSIDEVTKNVILKDADETLNRNFNMLGSGFVHMDPIAWQSDFIRNYSWPKCYYSNIRVTYNSGVDIKLPWELSRCHFLLWLGESYLLTGDERYAEDVVSIISNWIDENPLMHTVNWTCAMDVAIRSVNWLYALNMILDASIVSDSFLCKVYHSLYQHGFFIYHHMEKSVPFSNNHYAADLSGLLFLSQLFINTKRGQRWWRFSIDEYYTEVRSQILPSGMQYERSFSYHRLMTEMLAYPLYMLIRIGEEIPADISYRINTMYRFITQYTKMNQMAPTIADNDDGRFLPFVKRDFRDHSYLVDKNSIESIMICNGIKNIYDSKDYCESICFSDAGYAILRQQESYLLVSNGGFSKYPTNRRTEDTHTHNDLLSFVLSLEADDIIVDPGSYVYTPDTEKSNEFRSTRKHNTIIVDGEEQNGIHGENVFRLTKNSIVEKLFARGNFCEGSYKTIEGKVNHTRSFQLGKCELCINDSIIKGGAEHQAVMFFHLDPSIVVKSLGPRYVNVVSACFEISFSFESSSSFMVNVIDDTVSPSYGILQPSKTISCFFSFNDKLIINTRIIWRRK